MNKYNARKTVIDGITFDSAAESRRYLVLKDMEKHGEITGLTLQPKFTLYGGIKYKADFEYWRDGVRVVEDVKGVLQRDFKVKQKVFRADHPEIDFRVIKA